MSIGAPIGNCPHCGGLMLLGREHICLPETPAFDPLRDPVKAPSVCAQTLQTALELTGGDRAKTHGDKKQSHENIAELWTAYFGRAIRFTAHDVAIMMCLLKIARTRSGTHNPDNYVDLAGYAGIAAECADGQ